MNAAGRGCRWLVLMFLVRAGAAAADSGANASSLADSATTPCQRLGPGAVAAHRQTARGDGRPRARAPRSVLVETAQLVPAHTLRALPLDRVTDMIGLRAGVVAHGEELYVRGGRPGELVTQLTGSRSTIRSRVTARSSR
jgi:hypothetical protein